MSTAVVGMLNDLATGRSTIDEVEDKFRTFDWKSGAKSDVTDVDGVIPVPNSFDEVQVDSRLSTADYARLADAYRNAVAD